MAILRVCIILLANTFFVCSNPLDLGAPLTTSSLGGLTSPLGSVTQPTTSVTQIASSPPSTSTPLSGGSGTTDLGSILTTSSLGGLTSSLGSATQPTTSVTQTASSQPSTSNILSGGLSGITGNLLGSTQTTSSQPTTSNLLSGGLTGITGNLLGSTQTTSSQLSLSNLLSGGLSGITDNLLGSTTSLTNIGGLGSIVGGTVGSLGSTLGLNSLLGSVGNLVQSLVDDLGGILTTLGVSSNLLSGCGPAGLGNLLQTLLGNVSQIIQTLLGNGNGSLGSILTNLLQNLSTVLTTLIQNVNLLLGGSLLNLNEIFGGAFSSVLMSINSMGLFGCLTILLQNLGTINVDLLNQLGLILGNLLGGSSIVSNTIGSILSIPSTFSIEVLIQIIVGINSTSLSNNLSSLLLNLGYVLQKLFGIVDSTVGGNILFTVANLIQTVFGNMGGLTISITNIQNIIQNLLYGSNGVGCEMNQITLIVSAISQQIYTILVLILKSISINQGLILSLILNSLQYGILGVIIQLLGKVSISLLCSLVNTLLQGLKLIAGLLYLVFGKLSATLAVSGCNQNILQGVVIILNQILGQVGVLLSTIVGFGGRFITIS